MNDFFADPDLHEWEYNYITSPPPCPFCNDRAGDCSHVLLNIDKNANVCLSGYLYDLQKTDHLRNDISGLIREGHTPVISSKALQDLWQTAVDSFDPVNGIMNWDNSNYFDLLDEHFKEMGVLAFRYWSWGEEDVFDIYFAEKPEEVLETFHQYIMDELKMH
jgi:hypothetical protein